MIFNLPNFENTHLSRTLQLGKKILTGFAICSAFVLVGCQDGVPKSTQNEKVEAKLFTQMSDQKSALKRVEMNLMNEPEYKSRKGANLILKNKMTLGGQNNWNFTFQFTMPNTNALGQYLVKVRDGDINEVKFSERTKDGSPVK